MHKLSAETGALRETYAALNRNDISAVVEAFDPHRVDRTSRVCGGDLSRARSRGGASVAGAWQLEVRHVGRRARSDLHTCSVAHRLRLSAMLRQLRLGLARLRLSRLPFIPRERDNPRGYAASALPPERSFQYLYADA
jgi:hypothetical protein